MNRRGLMSMVAAIALSACASVSANALVVKTGATVPCACCGTACTCADCSCAADARAGDVCDCCGGSACCATTR